MSLLCWLPLNRNKQNYGCKLDYFSGQADFSNNGKIGKCLIGSSVLTTNESIIPNLISKTNIGTISCWAKIAPGTNAGWLIHLGESKGLKISPSFPQWGEDSFQNDSALIINNNTWKHIAITLDGTYAHLYINGEYISQTLISDTTEITAMTITIGGREGTYLNDIRIYDNCLSKMEVYEIAKGLVLHWKLDNLAFAGSDSSGLRNNGIVEGILTEKNNQSRSRYKKTLHFNGSTVISTKENQFSWFDFNTGTLSAWIYPSSNSFGNFGFLIKQELTPYQNLTINSAANKIQINASNQNPKQLLDFNRNENTLEIDSIVNTNNKLNFKITNKNLIITPATDYKYKSLSLTNYNNILQVVYANGTDYILLNSTINFPQNEWHFCAFTLNNSLLKIYFDGEKVADNFIIDWGTTTSNNKIQFQIGYNLFDDTYFIGDCNDIRFYATPLLDKDIKMLYNTNMRIDNLGGIHSFELAESNKASITLTGATTAFELKEDGSNAHLVKQNSHTKWLSPNFTEY